MCLITQQVKPKIAEEDILCFKVVRIDDVIFIKQNCFTTLFFDFKIKLSDLGNVLSPDWFEPDCKQERIDYGFHTFKNINETYEYKSHESRYYSCFILKAIIPKGSRYWEGKFRDYDSYCSEHIIYEKYEDESYPF